MDKSEIVRDDFDHSIALDMIRQDYDYFLIRLFHDIQERCEMAHVLLFDHCDIQDFVDFVYSVSTGPPLRLDDE